MSRRRDIRVPLFRPARDRECSLFLPVGSRRAQLLVRDPPFTASRDDEPATTVLRGRAGFPFLPSHCVLLVSFDAIVPSEERPRFPLQRPPSASLPPCSLRLGVAGHPRPTGFLGINQTSFFSLLPLFFLAPRSWNRPPPPPQVPSPFFPGCLFLYPPPVFESRSASVLYLFVLAFVFTLSLLLPMLFSFILLGVFLVPSSSSVFCNSVPESAVFSLPPFF